MVTCCAATEHKDAKNPKGSLGLFFHQFALRPPVSSWFSQPHKLPQTAGSGDSVRDPKEGRMCGRPRELQRAIRSLAVGTGVGAACQLPSCGPVSITICPTRTPWATSGPAGQSVRCRSQAVKAIRATDASNDNAAEKCKQSLACGRRALGALKTFRGGLGSLALPLSLFHSLPFTDSDSKSLPRPHGGAVLNPDGHLPEST